MQGNPKKLHALHCSSKIAQVKPTNLKNKILIADDMA